MPRKKKRKRRKRPLFKKYYRLSIQDESSIMDEKELQNVHAKLAYKLFGNFPNSNIGDWKIEIENLTLFIDPVFGNQLEIQGTFNMPLSKRLKIHNRLLELIEGGYSLSKAVKISLAT